MIHRNIIVHIGLHKTGTTFLQKHVFPKITSLTIIRAWHTHRQITDMVFKETVLITDEGISGDPWKGQYFEEFKRNILKIKHLYGDVKIIFGIRKHDAFILSLYKQYLHQKGYKGIEHMYNTNDTGILKLDDLFFNERILLLKKEFTNVFVYSQESLKAKPSRFFKALFQFMQVTTDLGLETLNNKEENVGVSTQVQISWLKKMNYINHKLSKTSFLPSLYNPKFIKYKITPRDICQNRLKNMQSKKFELPLDLKNHIKSYYAEDWEKAISYINY
tara:strand:- start:130278 stop:131102 length:825 start_codon:yes stop_codon:yes gene_type:complete